MRKSLAFIILLFTASSLFAVAGNSQALSNFPDYLSIRSEFLATLITAPSSSALAFQGAYRNTAYGRMKISSERNGNEFYVLFQFEKDGEYPLAARGNIIIRREVSTGYIKSIKWFLSDDGMSWLYMTPHNERTYIDYIVAGSVINSSVSVQVILYHFLMNHFTFLHNNTRNVLDWTLVLGSPGGGKADDFSRSLNASRPGNLAKSFFALLDDFGKMNEYMLLAGFPGHVPDEVTRSISSRIAHPANDRDNATFKTLKAGSIRLGSLIASIIRETGNSDAAWLALVEGSDHLSHQCLGIVASRDEKGFYSIRVWDSRSHRQIDWVSLVKSAPDAATSLFRLPVPGS